MDYEKSTIENNSADLVGFIEELGISPVHLVGHSYGGFASAFCASTSPQLIRTLTLIEPAVSTILLKNLKSKSEFLGLLLAHPSIAISGPSFSETHWTLCSTLSARGISMPRSDSILTVL